MVLEINTDSELKIINEANPLHLSVKKLSSSLKQPNGSLNNPFEKENLSSTFKRVISESDPQQINEYGVYLLVHQLLKKNERKHNRKQLRVAQQLLTMRHPPEITVHTSQSAKTNEFVEMMVAAAESATFWEYRFPGEMNISAFQLKKCVDRIKELFSKKFIIHANFKIEALQEFFLCLKVFTRLYLLERINTLLEN